MIQHDAMTLGPLASSEAQIGGALNHGGRLLARRLALGVWLMVLALSAGTYLVTMPTRALDLLQRGYQTVGPLQRLGLPVEFLVYYAGTLDTILYLAYTVSGIIIFWRKSAEWMALFASILLISGATGLVRPPDSLLALDSTYRLPMVLVYSLGLSAAIVFVYVFPDGRFVPHWTALPAFVAVLYVGMSYLSPVFGMKTLPWPPPPTPAVGLLALAGGVLLQFYRYRYVSTPGQKQQTSWVIYGFSIAILAMFLFNVLIPLFVPQVRQPGGPMLVCILIGLPVFYAAHLCFPLTLVLSILRRRLWQIDLIINRTLVYVPLTAILAGLSAATMIVLQKFFLAATGQQSDVAAVIATLVVVAGFTPVKDRLQKVVDRRFKPAGDPSQKLAALADEVRTRLNKIDRDQSTLRLLEVAVAAFDAKGGAVYWNAGGELRITHTLGEWQTEHALSVPIEAGGDRRGVLTLAARHSGGGYASPEIASLREVAALIGHAIEQDCLAHPAVQSA